MSAADGAAATCPKCGATQKEAQPACAKCGLAVKHWAGFRVEIPPHPAIDARWPELAARWDEDATHDAFVRLAAEVGGLDIAAARYREKLRESPDDRPTQRALAQLAILVERLHQEHARADPSTQLAIARFRWVVIGVCVVLLFVAAWLIKTWLMVR